MITPSDSPASPGDYAAVTPHGRGTAPYDIQAGNDEAAITAALDGANALAAAGVLYPMGPRQAMTKTLLSSPQGYGEQDIDAGYHGVIPGDDGWPANIEPGG